MNSAAVAQCDKIVFQLQHTTGTDNVMKCTRLCVFEWLCVQKVQVQNMGNFERKIVLRNIIVYLNSNC